MHYTALINTMKAQRNARIHANSENLSSSGMNVKPIFEWCSRKRQIVKMLQVCLKKEKSLIFCNQLNANEMHEGCLNI